MEWAATNLVLKELTVGSGQVAQKPGFYRKPGFLILLSYGTDRRDACPTALTKTPLLELPRRYLVQFPAAKGCYYV